MFEFAFLAWVAMSFAGWAVGRGKGRPVEGLVLGLILGAVGVVIIALMRPRPGYGSRSIRGPYGPGGQIGGYPGYGGYGQGGFPPSPGGPYSQPYPYGYDPGAQMSPPAATGESSPSPVYDVSSAPAWRPDPSGRWEYRWWDGHDYTSYVSRGGVPYTDSLPI